jgi:hypothetical protein
MREWVKALPLSLGLPVVIGAASVKPEDAGSNLSAWFKLAGFENIPLWLQSPSIDQRVILVTIILAVIYTAIVWGIPLLRKSKEIRLGPILLASIGAVLLIVAAIWQFGERSVNTTAQPEPNPRPPEQQKLAGAVVLYAKCGQPDISPFVSGTERYTFPFQPLEQGKITHGLLGVPKGFTITPDPKNYPSNFMQCSITNYGQIPVLNARLILGIDFRKAEQRGEGVLIGGELVQHVDWPIDIAKIEAGENKPFVFYLWNTSPHFAEVRISDNVSFQRSDENEERISKLMQPQVTPNFPLLFPPTRDITNKPN